MEQGWPYVCATIALTVVMFLKQRSRQAWLSCFLAIAFLLLGLLTLIHIRDVLRAQSLPFGFEFLWDASGFQVSESWLPFDDESTVAFAFVVGLINTIKVCVPAIGLAGFIGLTFGTWLAWPVAQVSPWFKSIPRLYVDALRNVPLLLQLLAWYFVISSWLPNNDTPLVWFNSLYLSKSGFNMPGWVLSTVDGELLWEVPERTAFAVVGGWNMSPEFLALSVALATYTGAYLAEVTRAGILSVASGQWQAALALGMNPLAAMRWVMFPQALRFMIPPATNQCMNLIKNSSLAVAVGYPDLMSISNTTLNQTGRAIECVLLVMGVYLCMSLLTAWVSHRFNLNSLHSQHNVPLALQP